MRVIGSTTTRASHVVLLEVSGDHLHQAAHLVVPLEVILGVVEALPAVGAARQQFVGLGFSTWSILSLKTL